MAARPTLQPCNHVEECQHLKPSPVAQWCRLQGDDTKMEVDWLTVLWPRADRFEVGGCVRQHAVPNDILSPHLWSHSGH